MDSNIDVLDGRERDGAEIKVLHAKEVLKLELRTIDVPENGEVLFSPSNPEYVSCFAQVHLKTYEDLQTLGLVPRRLAEDKVRQAMLLDDSEVYELAGRILQQSHTECGCADRSARTRGNPVRAVYNKIRKRHNPALARLLADHYGTQVSWDAPVAAIVRKWASNLNAAISVALVGDITIRRNAALLVAARAKSLMAWNIWIHVTGRLVSRSSYLKIWANSISPFTNVLNSVAIDASRKIAPLWTLPE